MSELKNILKLAAKEANHAELELIAEDRREEEFVVSKGIRLPRQLLPKLMYTWREASWVSGLGVRMLQRMAREGTLNIVRIGSSVRVRHVDIEELAKTHLKTGQEKSND
tara:strand:+ start:587 stop:913 length:327 start_codon:yes stop_codon:yes gene_type:complete